MLSRKEISQKCRLQNNYKLYREKFLKIKVKKGRIIPFNTTFKAQKKLEIAVNSQIAAGKPVRVIVLKARQEGISTDGIGIVFHRVHMRCDRTAFIVGHKMKSSDHLYEIAKTFRDQLPNELQWAAKYDNRKQLQFKATGSQLKVGTAEDEDLGKSETPQYVHGSEVAYWKKKKALSSILSSVPKLFDTLVILESTANLYGDEFHEMWLRAKEGKSDYIPVFIAWWEHEEYRMPVLEGFKPTSDEQKMMLLYDLDMEQVVWYRNTLENECKGNIDEMHKYFPSNDREPFISSGQMTFKSAADYLQERYEETRVTGYEQGELYVDEKTKRIKLSKSVTGWLKIWKMPDDMHRYILGADTAEGVAADDEGTDNDYDAGIIKSVRMDEQWETVAEIHERVDPDLFAYHSYLLVLMYHKAMILPEINKSGREYVKALLRLKYINIHYSKEKRISGKPMGVSDYGYKATEPARKALIAWEKECLRQKYTKPEGVKCITELLNFVTDKNGKDAAPAGKHDDLGIADALANMGCSLYPYTPNKIQKKRI